MTSTLRITYMYLTYILYYLLVKSTVHVNRIMFRVIIMIYYVDYCFRAYATKYV